MKNIKGFGLAIPLLLMTGLSAVALYSLRSNSDFTKGLSKEKNKFSADAFNSLIASSLTYENGCKEAWLTSLDPNTGLDSFITQRGGPIELNLPGDIVAKDRAEIPDYFITINSLKLTDFKFVQDLYSHKFYTGDVHISSQMERNLIQGNKVIQEQKVSEIAVITNSSGKIVACARSLAALEDNLEFQASKKAAIDAMINNPQAAAKDIEKLLDILSKDSGRTVTLNDLPNPTTVPAATDDCNITCQTVRSYYERNSSWYTPTSPGFNPITATTELLNYTNSQNLNMDHFAQSYNSLNVILADMGEVNNPQEGYDLYIKQNLNETNFNDFITVSDRFIEAANSNQTGTTMLIEAAINEGATVTQIAQNIDSITSKYSDDVITAWFSAGYTLTDAYAAGYLP